MSTFLYRFGLLIGLFIGFNGASTQAQNLLVNPGFESGNTGFTTTYTYQSTATTSGAGNYAIRTDESTFNAGFGKYNDHTKGNGTGLFLIADASGTLGQYVWLQTVTGLAQNTNYTFSFWLLNSTAASPATIAVSSGTAGATGSFTTLGTFSNPNTTGLWQQNVVTINTGSNTQLTIRLIDTNTAAAGNDFALDDMALFVASAVAPVANTVTNSPAIVNTSGPVALTPNVSAAATGAGNSIVSYTVFAPTAGTLYVNAKAVTAATPVTFPAANVSQLTYQPAAGTTTTATFNYTATDANANGSNTAVYSIPVVASTADVATTLSVSPTSVQAGNTLTFTATVTNNSAAQATGISPRVQLPAGLLLTAAALPSGATYTNATGVVTLPTTALLAGGASLSYAITFAAPNYTTTLAGVASSTATSTDPSAANNDGSQAAAQATATVNLPANGCAGAPYGSLASSGLYAEYYAGYFGTDLTYFSGKTPALTRTDGTVNFPATNSWGNLGSAATGTVDNPDMFSARYRGSITLATPGSYTFYLTSDDASYLWLDGAALAPVLTAASATINNGGTHGSTLKQTTVTLSAGVHNVLLYYGENTGGNTLTFEYSGPGITQRIVPNAVLCASQSQPPVANNVTNTPAILSNNGPTALAALSATDPDGQIDTYTVLTLPVAGAGVLYYNNGATTTAVTVNQVIPAANAGNLLFSPAPTFSGSATFTYLATDNSGEISNTATYTIPVVLATADIATTLSVSPTSVQAGNTLTFTATVKNNGPDQASGISPRVQLPAGLLLTAAALPSGATYTNATGVVTLPTTALLAGGASLSYAITFAAPNYTTTLAGVASSTATSTDPSAANNDGSQAAAQATATVNLPANGCAGAPYGSLASSGLYAEYYAGYFGTDLTYFSGKTPALTRTDGTVNFPATNSWGNLGSAATGTVDNPDMFSARYRGSITLATPGSYTFYLTSDDASYLWLDGAALAPVLTAASATINNGGTHGSTLKQTTVTLSAGVHNVLLYYGENTGGNTLTFEYSGPGITQRIVPNAVLCASQSQPPVANNVTNTPAILSNNGPTALAALSATDPDGQIDTYTVLTLPVAGAGVLYYNNGATTTAVTVNQVIPAANAGNLLFSPAPTFSGSTTFTYLATDNSGEISNTATYTIPVVLATADVTTTLAGPQQLGAGQPSGTYTAVFTNNGPSQATQVTQVITLPLGATMTAAQVTASGGTYTAGNATTPGTLKFGTAPVTLASGASNTYTFIITAPTTLGTNYSITSTVGTGTTQGSNVAPDSQTLTIIVTPANRFVANNDNNSLAANTLVRASVILNDDNPDATTAFTATMVTNPTHGAVTLNADGSYVYTPNPNYIGTDAFVYQICQTGTTPTCSNSATVKLNIYDPALVCTSGTGQNMLVNPSFTSGNTGFSSSYAFVPRPATKVTTGSGGLVPEGTYAVDNDANYYHYFFTGTGRTGPGDNFLIVNGAANIQKVYSQTVAVLPNRYYTFSVYANSVNPGSPAQLGFVINNESTSVVTTLDGTTNYVKLSDVWYSGNSTTATFEIRDVNRVQGGNDFGLDDVYFGTCTKNLLVDNITAPALPKNSNATAIPALTGTATGGPTLVSFIIQTLPNAASGTLALNGVAVKAGDVVLLADAGKLTFNPNPTFTGSNAVFLYTGTDNNGAGSDNTGTYTIPLDTPIIAVDDAVTTPLNTAVAVSVTNNDQKGATGSAIDLTTIDLQPGVTGIQQGTVNSPITVAGGSAYVNSSGQVVFTPTNNFQGTAFVPYTVKDAQGIVSNQATLTVRVVSQLDLATTISSPTTGGTVIAGQTVTISGTTANNSLAGTVADAVQQLQLPANLTGTPSFTRDGSSVAATYSTVTGLVVFPTLSNFAANSTSSFGVTFVAPATGPLTVTASVNNNSTDVNLVNNVATVTLDVTPQFDLTTSLTGPASVLVGNLATYTVTTSNNGPSPAVAAVQTVKLAQGLSGVFATNGGTYDSTTGIVTFPTTALASGQTQANTVSFAAVASFSPSATVTPNTIAAGDPTTNNNTAYLNGAASSTVMTVNGTITANSNLYVSVSGPGQVVPGASATYTVTQGNNGPDVAKGVQTQVSLPAGLTAANLTVGGQNGTANSGVVIFADGTTYTINTGLLVLPALAANQASAATPQLYTIVLKAPAIGTAITVSASVKSTTTDPVAGDNVSIVQTEIQQVADLAITVSRIEGGTTKGGTALTAGQTVTYSLQTVNNSTAAAQNVQQTVTISGSIPVASLQLNGLIGTFSSGIITFGNGATYNTASGLLALPALTLTGGGVQTNTLSFSVPDSGLPLQAIATVSSSTPDNVLTNNSATISNSVTSLQDLTVALAGPAQAVQGNPVFYTVTATNNGTSSSGQQTITLQLPAGMSSVTGFLVNNVAGTLSSGGVITFGTTGPTYTVSTGVLALPATAVKQPGSSTVNTVQFIAPVTPQLDLAATVTAMNEGNLTNNSAAISTLTVKSALTNADLSTTINPSAGTQAVGTIVTYTVTTTDAAGTAAQNVVQTVALPAGLVPATLRVNNTSGFYNRATGIVTYNGTTGNTTYNTATGALVFPTVATLALTGTSVNTIAFPMPVNGPVVVAATSSSDNPDATPSNNTVFSTTTITSTAAVAIGMSGPATTTAGSTVSYILTAANSGPASATDTRVTVTLPTGVTSYSLNGGAAIANPNPGGAFIVYGGPGNTVALSAGQSVTNVISFTAPTGTFTVNGAVSTTSTGTQSGSASVTTAPVNVVPVANDIVNSLQSPQGNSATTNLLLSPLTATDADGTVVSFTLLSLPDPAAGTLYVAGNAVTSLPPTGVIVDPLTISFDPKGTFVGSAFFNYAATDNGNGTPANALTSNVARYTIQIGQDNNSRYAVNDAKGGTVPYVNGDEIARVYDYNGGKAVGPTAVGKDIFSPNPADRSANYASGVTDTGVRSVTTNAAGNTLLSGLGLQLNASTGSITVGPLNSDLKKLKAGTYTLSITTTDANGGVNTQNVTFTIGALPLPVELTAFEARAKNLDALLTWHTASEKNSDHFDVERSLNGTSFVKIDEVRGQGTSSSATDYARTDAGIGAKVNDLVYYRLKQVDTDGTSSYSSVRTVRFGKMVPAIALFPNPATTVTNLDLTALPAGAYQVSVLDATGRVVLYTTLEAGLAHSLQLNTIASGSYMLLVRGANGGQVVNLTKRLIKE